MCSPQTGVLVGEVRGGYVFGGEVGAGEEVGRNSSQERREVEDRRVACLVHKRRVPEDLIPLAR